MKNAAGVAFVIVCSIVAVPPGGPSRASGPLTFTAAGPNCWDTAKPIPYRIDRGPLTPATKTSPGLDHATAAEMVEQAFQTWNNVPTAKLSFKFEEPLPNDVQTRLDYDNLRWDPNSGNFIVFDQEGEIVDAIYGRGNSNLILGFAAPIASHGKITRFISLMNGKLARSRGQFQPTLTHEFGHAVGLDHSQIQTGLANDGDPTNDVAIPTMFPTSTDAERAKPPIVRPLHGDDVAWISFLYGKSGDVFKANFGLIIGKVLRADNRAAVLGCNVVAIDEADKMNRRVSCVSDYLKKGTGEFVIPVPPGNYQIMIEPIRPNFVVGSSVGPYAESESDVSFETKVKFELFPTVHKVTAGKSTPEILLEAQLQPVDN